MSRRLIRSLKLTALAAASTLALSACDFSVYSLPLPGGADVGDNSYAVTIQFRDVLDLVPQSAVKVDEVTVGRVDDISLDGYTALVKVRLRGDVALPENAFASIRQTSLLGEKFVSISPPSDETPAGTLSEGDTIPLSRSGRNPEVEEVLGALSLLLNGGGVAQLKTISSELNEALSGNETEVRGVLGQLDEFMGQLDDNKAAIVDALRSMNDLSKQVKAQQQSIIDTVEQLPEALTVLNEQRAGLVRMMRGLKRLSPVAVRVIRSSKRDTLADLHALNPILTQLADAGDAVPKALQVFLTYPFADAVIGNTPTEARDLHQGDYTNLSAQLDVDLGNLPTIGLPPLPSLPSLPGLPTLPTLPSLPLPTLPTIGLPTITLPTIALPSIPVTLLPGGTITIPGGPTITVPLEITVPTVITLPTLGGPITLGLPEGGCGIPLLCRPAVNPAVQGYADAGYDADLARLLLPAVRR